MFDKSNCPHCEKVNYIYLGDPNDMTSSAGENPVAVCWKCKKRFFWVDMVYLCREDILDWDFDKSDEENLQLLDYEEGLEDDNG